MRKMKNLRLAAFTGMLIIGIAVMSGCIEEGEESTEQYTKFSENVFSFEVPNTWNRMKGSDLTQFRQQFEEQSKQLARQYSYTEHEDFKGVLYLAGFSAPREEALVIASVIQIPPQAEDYLDYMYESSEDKIRWGIDQGMIRKAFSNRKTEVNGIPVLEIDMEMADGSRMITYSFFSPDHPDQGVGLAMLCKPGQYDTYQSAFDHIISTLRISFPNEKSE